MRRTVLITGGSRGIGAACVQEFAKAGWNVRFLYRSRSDKALQLTEDLRAQGMDVACFQCDVASRVQVRQTIADILRTDRHIDALINNAGTAHIGLFTDMTEQQWDELFAVNVKGVFHCTQAVLEDMISEKRGCIVNVSSMWGEVGASCEAAYSAAKAAVIGLSKALAKEVGPSGIRVNCVTPGVIATDMNAELTEDDLAALADETPLMRIGQAEEVAKTIRFLCEDGSSFITGQVVGVSGGLII